MSCYALSEIIFRLNITELLNLLIFFKGIILFPKSIWNAKEQCQDIVTSCMSGEGNLQFYRKGRMRNDERVGRTELGAYVYTVVTWYI